MAQDNEIKNNTEETQVKEADKTSTELNTENPAPAAPVYEDYEVNEIAGKPKKRFKKRFRLKYSRVLFLPHFPASNNHQQRANGYAADLLEVAPELPTLCLALLAKLFGVFGLVAAALFAFVPEFLSHWPFLFCRIFCLCFALSLALSLLRVARVWAVLSTSWAFIRVGKFL